MAKYIISKLALRHGGKKYLPGMTIEMPPSVAAEVPAGVLTLVKESVSEVEEAVPEVKEVVAEVVPATASTKRTSSRHAQLTENGTIEITES